MRYKHEQKVPRQCLTDLVNPLTDEIIYKDCICILIRMMPIQVLKEMFELNKIDPYFDGVTEPQQEEMKMLEVQDVIKYIVLINK
jgi:hypothetical protein